MKYYQRRVFILAIKQLVFSSNLEHVDILTDDRTKQLKAFDDTKAGVKGLLDAAAGGVVDIPNLFIRPPDQVADDLERLCRTSLQVPVIDLSGVGDKGSLRRENIVKDIQHASENWGFFQVVNHGIPTNVLENMLKGVRGFHEQDVEVKNDYYSRDPERTVKYSNTYDLYMSRTATWRDTLTIEMAKTYHLDPQDLPPVCRDATVDYLNHAMKVVDTLLELLSEALGHYYPPCPKPDQTIGTIKHTDPTFIILLLQDDVGGLQVLHQNQWSSVDPIPSALIVNIGDFLQIISTEVQKRDPSSSWEHNSSTNIVRLFLLKEWLHTPENLWAHCKSY